MPTITIGIATATITITVTTTTTAYYYNSSYITEAWHSQQAVLGVDTAAFSEDMFRLSSRVGRDAEGMSKSDLVLSTEVLSTKLLSLLTAVGKVAVGFRCVNSIQ